MTASPLRTWSAWIPIAIPLFMFLLAVRHVVLFGITRETDEGTEAHLFQLLMPVALLVAVWFAVTWLPRAPARRGSSSPCSFSASRACSASCTGWSTSRSRLDA